jgi:dTDP-4-dehydrorhamnose reductase
MTRAFITGLGGFLGSNLAPYLQAKGWEVQGSWHRQDPGLKGVAGQALDICLPAEVGPAILAAKPDWVFHLAALADPDACASDPPATRQINVQGAKIVAQAAAKVGARTAFISTDQVFDGSRSRFGEDDAPAPLGVYGRSKHDAEAEVLAVDGRNLVVRLALTYGWGRGKARGRNFCEKWIRQWLTGGRVTGFADQFRTPIYALDACEALCLAAEAGARGLLHVAGPDRLSRHGFALRLAREFSFPEAAVQSASMHDVVFKDPRPGDASLSIERLKGLGFTPRGVDSGLKAMHRDLEDL